MEARAALVQKEQEATLRVGPAHQPAAPGSIERVPPDARVCPFCGESPGEGVFCAACGRNLSAVERLPTRAEWERERSVGGEAAPEDIALRCAEATSSFLAAMHAAGDPGTNEWPMPSKAFRRTRRLRGWVVRPVDREDFEQPKRYESGLVLSVGGDFHRLDSELRGWGQRDFPRHHHTVSAEPIALPAEQRLLGELARVLEAHRSAAS
jgi:hypothetical protein